MRFQHPDISTFPEVSLVIGAERARSGSGADWGHVYPGTGRVTREIRMASADDVDRAVAAAKSAQPAWRALPGASARYRQAGWSRRKPALPAGAKAP